MHNTISHTREEASQSPTVLVLDDEPNVLSGLRRALRKEPYQLLCATSADVAFDMLQNHAVDVVISDQDMPGMTGTVFLAKVRDSFPDATRFMLTGKATLEVALEAINDDAVSQFFTKPCDHGTLSRSIRNALKQKELEAALERARQQELELKDRLLSHVSHELRSPLTAIYQFTSLMYDGISGDLTQTQQDHLGIVLRNVKQLQTMVEDLLNCTRASTGKLRIDCEQIPISPLICDTITALQPTAESKRIGLMAHLPHDLPTVYADPLRIEQVLRNLIENGLKFTPPGGTVTVSTRELENQPEVLCCTVADTGCGIAPTETSRIFERLSQTAETIDADRQGLGLGLYICHELITRHNGHIWVESDFGHGSTFCFTLPLQPLQPATAINTDAELSL